MVIVLRIGLKGLDIALVRFQYKRIESFIVFFVFSVTVPRKTVDYNT